MLRFWSAILFLLVAPALGARAAEPCAGKTDGAGVVTEIMDGATLRLADGRILRLSGIEPPAHRDGAGAGMQLLGAWLLGKTVEFRHSSARPDRYGRMVAQLFSADDDRKWVQARLIAAGAGRVLVSAEQRACAGDLLAIEADARERGVGLWSDAAFSPWQATDPGLNGRDGIYAVVEGRVVSTSKTSTAVYVDFAGDRRTNFTAIVDARFAGQFEKAGKGAQALRGKWVRMRGWVYAWNGPAMRLAQPEAIEIVDAPVRRRVRNGDADRSD